jgi:hypothetical protein
MDEEEPRRKLVGRPARRIVPLQRTRLHQAQPGRDRTGGYTVHESATCILYCVALRIGEFDRASSAGGARSLPLGHTAGARGARDVKSSRGLTTRNGRGKSDSICVFYLV